MIRFSEVKKTLVEKSVERERISASIIAMTENITEGILVTDEHGGIIAINPMARNILGFSREENIALEKFNAKLKSIDLDNVMECIFAKKHIVEKEIVLPAGEAKLRVIKCVISPVKTASGRVIGTVVIFRDITKDREIERLRTEFTSTVSHELRTPLAVIKEGISLVLDETAGRLNDQQKKLLNISKNNSDRLERVINDFFDSTIGGGKSRQSN